MKITSILWTKILLGLILIVIIFVAALNYIVDPYNLYKTNLYKIKPKLVNQMRLVKLSQVRDIKPKSVILGTSRADLAIDPNHNYFNKPSYNLSNSGATIYETKFYVKDIVKQKNLESILLVLDWRMFNDEKMKKTEDFESYFNFFNPYKFLLNYTTFKDSIYTLKNQNTQNIYFDNGLMNDSHMASYVIKEGGHLKLMKKEERFYYSIFSSNNTYKDTGKNSFDDFKEILQLCYKNNIKLNIIFGPSHIRQWESFDYHIGYNVFVKWKRDVVFFVEKIAKEENKEPFKIVDFSVYHELTAEQIPKDNEQIMKYHWESSHYKKELGNIVLDRLLGISSYKDFGTEINIQNIDEHIIKLKEDRTKFIDTEYYRKQLFEEQ